ncbi:hypothetical protein BCR36DRAFT_313511 [Piromyces finnis]|uniref:Chitin-binding type-1 domain-containing protein n=1 Tax=Piromyces finnis TaxID=1754191 RepID=A0A1Y1ULW9_9FUNG|nr:hypothetical protein BCR36DRAFT_313756 [Piromyces finnis]ORX38125.1 hypothetical protein BCR36DRAFT_313511 [Piromyces finnis]|eukprot:ORX36989.1 hypothetical protein BCR36DRAFT_313756 [Piromyces finnis]
MSENNDVKFNYTTVLNYLNKLGLKNIINGIKEGPNLFINNGKHVVYSKDYIYYGCGINSGNQSCENNQCCGANGKCYNHSNDLCKTSNGCQVEYGKCNIITSNSKNNLCGFNYGNCHSGYCCSYEGICGKTNDHCGVGCQKNYGHCL